LSFNLPVFLPTALALYRDAYSPTEMKPQKEAILNFPRHRGLLF